MANTVPRQRSVRDRGWGGDGAGRRRPTDRRGSTARARGPWGCDHASTTPGARAARAGAEIRVALRSRDDVVGCRKGSLLPSVAVPVTTRQRPLCGLFDVAAQAPDRNALRSWLDRAPAAPFGLPAPGPRWVSGVGRVRPIVLPLHGCAPEDALVGAFPLLLHLE